MLRGPTIQALCSQESDQAPVGPFFRGVSGQQCVFAPVHSWEPSHGKGCGWACPSQRGWPINQREPLILRVLAFLSLGVGLAGLLCVPGLQRHPPGVSIPAGIPERLKPSCSW